MRWVIMVGVEELKDINMKKRAIIYYRSNEESVFLEAASFVERNDLTLIGEIGDEREEDNSDVGGFIDSLMYWIEEEEVEHIIVTSLVSLGRTVIEAIEVKNQLDSMGICLWSMNTNTRTINDDGTVNEISDLVFKKLKAYADFENGKQ